MLVMASDPCFYGYPPLENVLLVGVVIVILAAAVIGGLIASISGSHQPPPETAPYCLTCGKWVAEATTHSTAHIIEMRRP